jgi:hypothetical protein
VIVAGCSGGSDSDGSGENSSDSQEAEKEATEQQSTNSRISGRLSVDEQTTSDGGTALTVEKVRLANEIRAQSGPVFEPAEKNRYLLVRMKSKNRAEEAHPLARVENLYAVTGETQYSAQTDFGGYDQSLETLAGPVEGELYTGNDEAVPGVSTEGWLVYEIPAQTEQATVAWTRTYPNEHQSYWGASLNPGELPELSVTSISAPDSVERYEEIDLTVTVENSGGRQGQFNGELTSPQLETPIPVTGSVPSDSTRDISVPVEYPYTEGDTAIESATYSLGESLTAVEYTVPIREIGETYTTPSGVEVSVQDVQFADSFTTGLDYDEGTSAGPNQQFVFVRVQNRATGQAGESAGYDGITLHGAGETYTVYDINQFTSLEEPIRGEFLGTSLGTLDAGETSSGWVVFETSAQVRRSNLTIEWAADAGFASGYDIDIKWAG